MLDDATCQAPGTFSSPAPPPSPGFVCRLTPSTPESLGTLPASAILRPAPAGPGRPGLFGAANKQHSRSAEGPPSRAQTQPGRVGSCGRIEEGRQWGAREGARAVSVLGTSFRPGSLRVPLAAAALRTWAPQWALAQPGSLAAAGQTLSQQPAARRLRRGPAELCAVQSPEGLPSWSPGPPCGASGISTSHWGISQLCAVPPWGQVSESATPQWLSPLLQDISLPCEISQDGSHLLVTLWPGEIRNCEDAEPPALPTLQERELHRLKPGWAS